MVVGNEARELRNQKWIMKGLEWVKEFGFCPLGSTGCQQRWSFCCCYCCLWSHIIILVLQKHCLGVNMDNDLDWGDSGLGGQVRC